MDNQVHNQIKDLVQKNDRFAIAVGRLVTVDEMGAALALYLALTQLNKKVSIASAAEPLVEHSSLIGIDKVKPQFEGEGGDLVVSFPYREGEIEKVSYTIENNFLNIVVKAGEKGLTFEEQDVRFARGGSGPQVLFIVGTPRLSDLGSLFNPDALKDTLIVNIDTKADNQGFGDVVLISKAASSLCEEMAKLLVALGVDTDIDQAQNLFSGIIAATQNFQHSKTTPDAFEIAGKLMQKGAVRTQVVKEPESEERVSSFMPEQMLSQSHSTQRPAFQTQPAAPVGNQQAQAARMQQIQQALRQGQVQQGQRPISQATSTTQPIKNSTNNNRRPPSDWLTPKVYKGSTDIS
jgi:nanoRNase/pAp phosphatase (c-di-AMP/oligoRNAs hydrolase)